MSESHSRRRGGTFALMLALAAASLAGCGQPAAPGNGSEVKGGEQEQAQADSPCGVYAPVLNAALPVRPAIDQPGLDCAAWQTFIALNWRADPAKPGFPDPAAAPSSFGTPGDLSPKVWETYLEAAAVFGGPTSKGLWQAKRPGVKSLVRTSKFGETDLSDITQAGGDHFLTNQRGDVTYYEVMMNQDEYEFITTQEIDLTTAAGQLECATQPGNKNKRGGFSMPSGAGDGWVDTDCKGNVRTFGQDVGSMEIKAAWTPLPADHSLDYRYKTSTAQIKDPSTGSVRTVTVGLVGMHIIHKSPERQQWTWATFEHVDNSPDSAATPAGFAPPAFPPNPNWKPSPGFTFFNASCDPASDPVYGCKTNMPPTPCSPVTNPCQPYSAPMQITRITPVGDPANAVTGYAWALLPAESVFNYYRLINVQWRPRPTILPPGQTVPAPSDGFIPADKGPTGANQIVANTTLESFQQTQNSCLDCHQFASIAQPPSKQARTGTGARLRKLAKGQSAAPAYASDYSFIFFSETKK